MNDQQVHKALEACRTYIHEYMHEGLEARELCEGSKNAKALFPQVRVEHLLWMCNQAQLFVDFSCPAFDSDKAHRWLGFIQGCLWMMGCSINEMRNMNKPGSSEAKDGGT